MRAEICRSRDCSRSPTWEHRDPYSPFDTRRSTLMPPREALAHFKAEDIPWCTFQTWLPDEESEASLYLGHENHGDALTGIPVRAGTRATFEYIYNECATNPHFASLSAVNLDHWIVLLTA